MAQTPKRKKKVDYEAINSPFNRIPGIDTMAARALLDLGFSEVHELRGRAPEVLFEKLKGEKPDTPDETLAFIKLAVYYAETDEPDPQKLYPFAWM